MIPFGTELVVPQRPESMSLSQPYVENGRAISWGAGSDTSGTHGSLSPNGSSILEAELDKDQRRLVIFLPKKSCRYLTIPCECLLFRTLSSQEKPILEANIDKNLVFVSKPRQSCLIETGPETQLHYV